MEHTSTFLGVTPDAVFAEFVNADFLVAFSEEVGVVSGELSESTAAGVVTSAMPWTFPTDRPGIPSLARKFLPGEVRLDWEQRWGPLREPPVPGAMTVELHGTPRATVEASAQLLQQGDTTVYKVVSRTRTSLKWPLAGTVESSIDKDLVGWILQVQARVLRRRLGLAESR